MSKLFLVFGSLLLVVLDVCLDFGLHLRVSLLGLGSLGLKPLDELYQVLDIDLSDLVLVADQHEVVVHICKG